MKKILAIVIMIFAMLQTNAQGTIMGRGWQNLNNQKGEKFWYGLDPKNSEGWNNGMLLTEWGFIRNGQRTAAHYTEGTGQLWLVSANIDNMEALTHLNTGDGTFVYQVYVSGCLLKLKDTGRAKCVNGEFIYDNTTDYVKWFEAREMSTDKTKVLIVDAIGVYRIFRKATEKELLDACLKTGFRP